MANDNLPNGVRGLLASQGKIFVSLETEATGDGSTFAFNKDDYTQDSMQVVTKMAIETIAESQNVHKLENETGTVSITQGDGKPVKILDGGPGSSNSYSTLLGDENTSGVRKFETLSDTEMFSSIENKFSVIKGNALPETESQKNYIDLLGEVAELRGDSVIGKATAELQQKNNRYSQNNSYIVDGQKEDENGLNIIPIQNIPGRHTPQTWPSQETGTEIKLQNLKNLGTQLILKAAGEIYVPEDVDNVGDAVAAKAASLAPGYVRLGAKLPMSEIQIDNIIDKINPEFSKNKSPSISGTPTLSHGSYNNPLAPFDSFDSRSSAAGATLLVITVSGIIRALALAIGNDNEANTILGSVFNTSSNSFFNIQYVTRNDFYKSVERGLNQFFAIQGPTTELGAVNALRTFNSEPGYYNTILRGLVRMIQYDIVNNGLSGADLITAGVGRGSSGFGAAVNRDLDINRNVGLSNDPTNIANIVRAFANSKLVAFIGVLAQMGDISLTQDNLNLSPGNGNHLGVGPQLDELVVDYVEESDDFGNNYLLKRRNRINPASLIMKNRLSPAAGEAIGQKSPLSWANATTPSTYLLPKNIIDAAAASGDSGAKRLQSKLSSINGVVKNTTGNRLPSEMVDQIESLLDASYVPFYFHDLRTNEIISFHAFLESISDNFAAEYNEQTAYGRIGKIYTYKNTDRTISLSFMAVATNDKDFEEMWWKINKLITMVYPQYTAGRTIERQGEKFTQPFSQLPAASPLIRLRLGDLFKSNYSKFHLARLFGLGESQDLFSLTPNTQTIGAQNLNANPNQNEIRTQIRTRLENGDFEVGDKFVFHRRIPAPQNGVNEPRDGAIGVITEKIPTGVVNAAATPQASNARRTRRGRRQNRPQEIQAEFIYKASFADRVQIEEIIPKSYYGHKTVFSVDENYLEQKVREQLPSESTNSATASESESIDPVQKVKDFFSSDSNPILQSFNTVRGKGLPGFIKSIDFDWGDANVTWETSIGNTAPKSCKISISFAPIWDIAPGLDSNGFTTSPAYGVGNAVKGLSEAFDQDNNSATITNRLLSKASYDKGNNDDGSGFNSGGIS